MDNPDIVKRYEHNPILTRHDIPYPVMTVHNAGVVRHNGTYIMLFRSHRQNGRSVIGLARSDDGYNFEADPEPFLTPATSGWFADYEEYGVEDLRISPVEGEYLLSYSGYSRHGVRIGLARTTDFESVERISMISQPDMRNVVIFPEKFDGRYARLDRPHTHIAPWAIWLSWSPDLIHWGDSKMVVPPQPYHWDELKVGPGAPPLKTSSGWLNIYHGVFETMAGAVYRLGVALHDLENPEKVLGIADPWILQPEDQWEVTGYVPNVVFTCAAIEDPEGEVRIWWGGADSVMCTGSAKIDDLVRLCLENPRQ